MALEMIETALFPPLVRFFIGLLLVLLIEGTAVFFAFWLWSKYGKEE